MHPSQRFSAHSSPKNTSLVRHGCRWERLHGAQPFSAGTGAHGGTKGQLGEMWSFSMPFGLSLNVQCRFLAG